MRFVTFLVLMGLVVSPLRATPGETGLASTKIGIGSRITAMGDAGTASADEVTAMYWNPAGLTYLPSDHAEIVFMRNQWLQKNNNGNYLGMAFRLGTFVLGTGIALYSSNNIGLYGNTPSDDGPVGYFSAHDVTASLAVAYHIAHNLSAGITLNGLYAKIYTEAATGLSVTTGVRYSCYKQRLQFGLVVRHLGGTNALYQEKIVLPLTVAGGVTYRFVLGNETHILASGDLVQVRGEVLRLLNGIEFRYHVLALQVGYKTAHTYYQDAFTFGGGIILSHFRMHYAYVPFSNDLGNAHRFTCTMVL